MKILLALLVSLIGFSCNYHSYYIVRHAEKEAAGPNMSGDVPLTPEGKERAQKLLTLMEGKKLVAVYSTNTIRTRSTVQPTADDFHLPVRVYGPRPDSTFIAELRKYKANVLVVGHSNTVDDIVNALTGENKLKDLEDSEYNRLFVVRMRGKKVFFEERKIYPDRNYK
jgi:2,3-bisphosphoglycerate-dependent phosphoglycerate mutase